MIKKILIVLVCIAMLLSIVACSKDNTHLNSGATIQSENSLSNNTSQPSKPTEEPRRPTEELSSPTEESSQPSEELSSPTEESSQPTEESKIPTEEKKSVFNTENIIRITFYAYYGSGKGSDVPAEHLDEIISWLDSFEVDTSREFPDLVPPGTNTIYVEIEYSDRSIVKHGMDTTVVDGVPYYIKGDPRPECYYEIISRTSLS